MTNINITMNVNDTDSTISTKRGGGGCNKKAVMCKETGEIFNSTVEAAKCYHVTHGAIASACRGLLKTVKGMHFCYMDNNNNPIEVSQPDKVNKPKRIKDITVQKEAVIEAEGKRDNKNCKFVMCITDGKYFTSVLDAAEHYNITPCMISRACNGVVKSTNGKQFCFLKDIPLYLKEISNAINKSNAYDILVEKERLRKELIADVDKCQDDVYAIEMKLCEAKQALEKAQHALATFN